MDAQAIIQSILKYKNRFWLLVSLVVAFGLRMHALDAQSLWNDEGTSVALAPLSLEAIINGAAKDIHPPLYYILLHYWIPWTGLSEFAVRFLSVVAGVLVVAVTYRIARSFFDLEVAIIAAFLSAFSPFQVYYSQETRMYIWVTLFAAVSAYATARVLEWAGSGQTGDDQSLGPTSPPLGIWALYLAATIAMLYTQYFGAFVLVAENLAIGIWLAVRLRERLSKGPEPTRDRSFGRMIAFWVAAQILVTLAFAPWYLLAGSQLATWPAISEPVDLVTLVWKVLNVYSVGLSLDASSAFLIAIAFGVLVLSGLRIAKTERVNFGIVMQSMWMIVPVGLMYILSLSRPAYNPKFLLPATPPFFILAARGLSTIHAGIFLSDRHPVIEWRPFRFLFFIVAVVAAVGFIPSLRNYYSEPVYARDDYRAILKSIDVGARDGDGILVDDKGQIGVVRYYHQGNQPLFQLPRMRPPDPATTRADVDDMLARTRRLFAIYYATEQSDPQGIVEGRLAETAFKAQDEWHGNVRLAIYGVAPADRAPRRSLDVRMGDEIRLQDYVLDSTIVRPGDVLTLTLDWQAISNPTTRYKVFVHLLDPNDEVIAQRDGEPVADRRITTTWRPGEALADNYGVWIDANTPPGDYRVEIGMYRADNGARLALTGKDGKALGDHLVLETVHVTR